MQAINQKSIVCLNCLELELALDLSCEGPNSRGEDYFNPKNAVLYI